MLQESIFTTIWSFSSTLDDIVYWKRPLYIACNWDLCILIYFLGHVILIVLQEKKKEKDYIHSAANKCIQLLLSVKNGPFMVNYPLNYIYFDDATRWRHHWRHHNEFSIAVQGRTSHKAFISNQNGMKSRVTQ